MTHPSESVPLDDPIGATTISRGEYMGNDKSLATEQRDHLKSLLDDASSTPTSENISHPRQYLQVREKTVLGGT
jgi:hypothetical protein